MKDAAQTGIRKSLITSKKLSEGVDNEPELMINAKGPEAASATSQHATTGRIYLKLSAVMYEDIYRAMGPEIDTGYTRRCYSRLSDLYYLQNFKHY